ncbi:MAG: hypothetical protein KF862_10175 [Chitinophagaceae bacterium]|nr:hypothetical protein [Chitinophagaceae bacterium]
MKEAISVRVIENVIRQSRNLNKQLNQFKTYIGSVQNWDDFKYIFNKLKTHDVDLLRKEFQKFMANNATEIYNANPALMHHFKLINGRSVQGVDDFIRALKNENFFKQLSFIEIW